MEAQALSSYTDFLQQPWYIGRGLFVDPPTVYMHCGRWNLLLPDELHSEENKLKDLFIHGAGGMHMVDPLFQRVLVKEGRNREIPVIFDEVFTGFWRLGVESAAELLHCSPDIACFAKLLTGGMIPLAATLATEAVFQSFMGDSKLKALLRGHSYTTYAIGCTAAVRSIMSFKDPKKNPNLPPEGRVLREFRKSHCIHKSKEQLHWGLSLCWSLKLKALMQDMHQNMQVLCSLSSVKMVYTRGHWGRDLSDVWTVHTSPCLQPVVGKAVSENRRVSQEQNCILRVMRFLIVFPSTPRNSGSVIFGDGYAYEQISFLGFHSRNQ